MVPPMWNAPPVQLSQQTVLPGITGCYGMLQHVIGVTGCCRVTRLYCKILVAPLDVDATLRVILQYLHSEALSTPQKPT